MPQAKKKPKSNVAPNPDPQATGFIRIDIRRGLYTNVILPSPEVWNRGAWLSDLQGPQLQEFQQVEPKERYNTWVVSAEKTPGNYKYRLYTLPLDIANVVEPTHPLNWPEAYKKDGGKYAYPPSTKTTTSQPTFPAGIRFRCRGCGHWWRESTLAPHTTHCCPGLNGGESDWAIECECCDRLDETAACKPGYPKKKEVKEPKEPKEATASA